MCTFNMFKAGIKKSFEIFPGYDTLCRSEHHNTTEFALSSSVLSIDDVLCIVG